MIRHYVHSAVSAKTRAEELYNTNGRKNYSCASEDDYAKKNSRTISYLVYIGLRTKYSVGKINPFTSTHVRCGQRGVGRDVDDTNINIL